VTSRVKRFEDFEWGEFYRPDILYSYTVDGHEYSGKDISLVNPFGDIRINNIPIAEAESVCDRFPEGSRHIVRYNPAKPAKSALVSVREAPEN
jgi:hypothetical protein